MTNEEDMLQKIIQERSSLIMNISQKTGELHKCMQIFAGLEFDQLRQSEIIEKQGSSPEQEKESQIIEQQRLDIAQKVQNLENHIEGLEQQVIKLDEDLKQRLES